LQFLFPGGESTSTSATKGRKASVSSKKIVMCVVLVAICSQLQGCGGLFSHPTPAWEQYASYWDRFQFVPEGQPAKNRIYNSCDVPLPKPTASNPIPGAVQCSGHGECAPWRSDIKVTGGGKNMQFCKCYRDYADPECRTRRKSQKTAYFLSVFLGIFGGDHMYLGNYFTAFAKAATLGGVGVWWVFDIVRLGSSPVYTDEFRLAYDLPHWLYVMFTCTFFSVVGYFVIGTATRASKYSKARASYLRQEEKVHQKDMLSQATAHPEDSIGMPTFASYPLPMNQFEGYGSVPANIKHSGAQNPFSPWAVFKHATDGYTGPPGHYDGRMRPKSNDDFNYRSNHALPVGQQGTDFAMRPGQWTSYEGAKEQYFGY